MEGELEFWRGLFLIVTSAAVVVVFVPTLAEWMGTALRSHGLALREAQVAYARRYKQLRDASQRETEDEASALVG